MFATSTKTATFLPTCTPCRISPRARARCRPGAGDPSRAPRGGPYRRDGSPQEGAGEAETLTLPAGEVGGIIGRGGLHGRGALVACRADQILQDAGLEEMDGLPKEVACDARSAHGVFARHRVAERHEALDGPTLLAAD